ncbi:MAG TPA: PatB family C-S lyase [Candidatus Dormibacteraeota bacterium]|jgi:cystathionine beta-lyase|nr:PatB family C-S lyase [Candidatus Dormibacteraeota bacterium]
MDRIPSLSVETMRARRGIKWHRYPDDVLPAWVADMDFPVAPAVQAAVSRLVEQMDYGYPWREGEATVEAAFVDRMRERFGWAVEAERVRPVTDLVQAIVAALVAFSRPGEGVVVQTPIYPPFLGSIAATGRRPVFNPLRDDGSRFVLDLEGLEAAIDGRTRILLLCNPHNPTGRVFAREELEALGRIAVAHDLVIVADEIHCDLVYPGRRHLPMGSLGTEIAARTVTLNSATKGFNVAGLRCGVMHFGSEELLDRFRRAIPDRLLGSPSSIAIDAAVAAWREGQPWLEALLPLLQHNRDRVATWATEAGVRHHPPEGTYLAWLDLGGLDLGGASAHRFLLERARVALNAGEDFGPGYERCARLNFATSPEILERILGRMGEALRRAEAVR